MVRMKSLDRSIWVILVNTTIKQLAELVVELVGSSSKLVYQPLPADDPTRRQPDISLAKQHYQWEPKVPLREEIGQDD